MNENKETKELLPCPCCGGTFKMSQEPHDNGYVAGKFYIYHAGGGAGCLIDVHRHFESADEAVEAWNTRAALRELDRERDVGIKPLECKHEPFEGRCVHCDAPFVNGSALVPSSERDALRDRVAELEGALLDLCDAWEVPGTGKGGGRYRGNVTRAYNAARTTLYPHGDQP